MTIDRYDILVLLGLAMLGVGLWLISPPLALSVVGAAIAAVGLAGSAASARRKG